MGTVSSDLYSVWNLCSAALRVIDAGFGWLKCNVLHSSPSISLNPNSVNT